MSENQQAFEAGYYEGYRRAAEEAKSVLGPRFFVGDPPIAEAFRRRERFMFWVRLIIDFVLFLPGAWLFWMVLQYAHDLREQCYERPVITKTRSR